MPLNGWAVRPDPELPRGLLMQPSLPHTCRPHWGLRREVLISTHQGTEETQSNVSSGHSHWLLEQAKADWEEVGLD